MGIVCPGRIVEPAMVLPPNGPNCKVLQIPPRRMWGWMDNVSGYCGETSFQSSLLYFGSYVSAELCRYADGNEELLLDENDVKAAKKLQLRYEKWDCYAKKPQCNDFFMWVREHLNKGHPVIAGFYQKKPHNEGDEDYDHIMPIVGYVDSPEKLLYFNDLYKNSASVTKTLHATRYQWVTDFNQEPVQPFEYTLPTDVCYGIAILGNVNDSKCCPCRLEVIDMFLEPDWGAENKVNATPIPIKGVLHLENLRVGSEYAVLCYDSQEAILKANFKKDLLNQHQNVFIIEKFVADSDIRTICVENMISNGCYYYRVIPTDVK